MGNKQSGPPPPAGATESPDPTKLRLKQVFKELAGEDDLLSKESFIALFKPFSTLAELLHGYECGDTPAPMTEDRFTSLASNVLSILESTAQVEFCTLLYTQGKPDLDKTVCTDLLHTLCGTSWAYVQVDLTERPSLNESATAALVSGIFGREETVPVSAFVSYVSKHCPVLAAGVFLFMKDAFLMQNPLKIQAAASMEHSEMARLVLNGECLLNTVGTWLVSTILPSSFFPRIAAPSSPLASMMASGGWYLLYSSNSHGLSVNRFQHHVFEYKGASVMFFTFGDNCFCLTNDSEWREDVQQKGGCEMMCVQVTPTYKVIADGGPMLYLNLTNRTAPRCLRIGKRTTILEIDNDFNKVKYYGIEYNLHGIEVWGCAGATALQEQKAQKEWERKQVDKHKDRKLKIDKDEWKDSPDRQILELGGVQTEHAER